MDTSIAATGSEVTRHRIKRYFDLVRIQIFVETTVLLAQVVEDFFSLSRLLYLRQCREKMRFPHIFTLSGIEQSLK
jgi:hypothetical protein